MTLIILDGIKAALLGIVEGFTEFLPISSTGHLILINEFISFDKEFTLLFDIVIQLGAILAVLVYFWKRLWPFSKDRDRNKTTWNIWLKSIVGISPAIILGFLFAEKIEENLFNPWTVAITLILGGLIILYIERKNHQPKIGSISNLTFKTAFFIGLIQCLSMIPGTSRSAATIIGAMVLGANRVVATEFSFFLAIPTMIAASTWSLLKYNELLNPQQIFILSVGFIVSFFIALAVIKFLINYVQKNNFKIFGYYRIILGLMVTIYFLTPLLPLKATISLLVALMLGYLLGRWSDYYLNFWLKDPSWAPDHWIYGFILMIAGLFYFNNNLGLWMFFFGAGFFVSDLKDFLRLKFMGPDNKAKEQRRFWHID